MSLRSSLFPILQVLLLRDCDGARANPDPSDNTPYPSGNVLWRPSCTMKVAGLLLMFSGDAYAYSAAERSLNDLLIKFVLWFALSAFAVFLTHDYEKQFGKRGVGIWGICFAILSPIFIFPSQGFLQKYRQIGTLRNSIAATSKALTIAGLTIPSGSYLEFRYGVDEQWSIAEIRPSEPIAVGTHRIVRMLGHFPPDGNTDEIEAEVELASIPQINGWRCLGQRGILVRIRNRDVMLTHCALEQIVIGETTWPEGTELHTDVYHEDRWRLRWSGGHSDYMSKTCDGPIVEISKIPMSDVLAEYDKNMDMVGWSGSTCPDQRRYGHYLFSGHAKMLPSKEIELTGSGTDTRTGESANCILLDATGKHPQLCSMTE